MSVNSRAKGAAGERELSKYLNEHWGLDTHRGTQDRGAEAADVVGLPGYWVECKRVERIQMLAWCRQAERDAPASVAPLVVWRPSREPWRVTLGLDDFLSAIPRLG